MNQDTLKMFKTLTELPGAPGFEKPVRDFMRVELAKYSDELVQDHLGGIFGIKKGDGNGPVVMAAGHMDEVGFIVTKITENGCLKFHPLGGWWEQVLLAQRVEVLGKNGPIMGVVGSIPPHLLDVGLKSKPMQIANMLIDIGADSREEVEQLGIRPGTPIVPYSQFTQLANKKKLLAKAWDNRYGCGLAIELLKELKGEKLPNTLYSGATVQEESGLRGATVAANLIKPDIFFAMDCGPANDASGNKTEFGQLGKGALVRFMDRTMITSKSMVEFILDTASDHKIPFQYFMSMGGTDAGSVHLSNIGVPSAVIAICARYIHTHTSILHTDDYAAAKQLIIELVRRCDKSTVDLIKTQEY
ncbi:MAG: glutamyl aminopeptidase [Bacillales bacterium]|jgi:putative aminopeptidase FrvX|nr:glutamyl aminopeptidase [Bacillales bacterium]